MAVPGSRAARSATVPRDAAPYAETQEAFLWGWSPGQPYTGQRRPCLNTDTPMSRHPPITRTSYRGISG